MMHARPAGIDCATGKFRSHELLIKRVSIEKASVKQMPLSVDTVNIDAGWWMFECNDQTDKIERRSENGQNI